MIAPDARNRELAAIHIGAQQLGMDTSDKNPASEYRSMLWTHGRVYSAADLDQGGRTAVIEHLRKRGFTKAVRPAQAHDHGKKPKVPADRQGLVDKLEAQLAASARPWNYVRAMAKRMFKLDKLEWASAEQLRKLVAALEYDARRRAVRSS